MKKAVSLSCHRLLHHGLKETKPDYGSFCRILSTNPYSMDCLASSQ